MIIVFDIDPVSYNWSQNEQWEVEVIGPSDKLFTEGKEYRIEEKETPRLTAIKLNYLGAKLVQIEK